MDEATTRVFFAITFDDHIRTKLCQQIDFLKNYCSFPVRWIRESQLHLTLRFIGNVSETELDLIYAHFELLEKRVTSFDLELKHIIAFPVHKPRVIGIEIPLTASLSELVKTLEEQLDEMGFTGEEKEFLPHITLGRIAKPRRKALIVDNLPLDPSKQTVDKVTLFKSQLTPDGSIYTPLKAFKLKSLL